LAPLFALRDDRRQGLFHFDYFTTSVCHLTVLWFELGLALTSLTVAVSLNVVFTFALTWIVICTRAPVGFLFVQAGSALMLHTPATLPHELLGGVMEQTGNPRIKLHDSIAYPELTKVVPAGMVSATLTSSAVLGPVFATPM